MRDTPMPLSLDQTTQTQQKLTMTPQMRQIVECLSMDGTSTARKIRQFGLTNPSVAPAAQAEQIAQTSGLYEHAALWINAHFTADERAIALQFLDALELWGWLGESLERICATAGVSITTGSAVLERLQAIEPAGLFARSLTECLALQVKAAGDTDPIVAQLLHHLPEVQHKTTKQLAALCGCSVEDILNGLKKLRSFDPKPGLQFAIAPPPPTRGPDLLLQCKQGHWSVSLHPDSATHLNRLPSIDPKAQQEADRFENALSARNATLLAIAKRLVALQQTHLTSKTPLTPITMCALATDVARHKSTLSRVFQWATVEIDAEVLPLRHLLGPKLRGHALSPEHLMHRITQLVSDEDSTHPLSDAQLAEALASTGIAIPRRTIAKYRAQANIPAAHARRQHRSH
ncbi:hypothetical protein J7400_17985 [Shimia sp. R9_2]|uniref:RNA polymerase factor sigma-54 n=1 Tax=Shimia sp. R9_2 TaxID=2821112 RepID=UPI001ADC5B4F|nr:hypothetical protein [Shimia sp. R9_2]MBO9398567.1 hypothetical protein [Shimia sp. R9_2]